MNIKTQETMEPWDDPSMSDRLLELVLSGERWPLTEFAAAGASSRCSGAYLHWIVSPALPGVLGNGAYPVYAGLAGVDLHSRTSRYRQSLNGITAFPLSAVHVLWVPCRTRGAAAWAEAELIRLLEPPLQGSSYGSKVPGAGRPGTGRKVSPIDALFPGRSWAREPSVLAHASVQLELISWLARLDPSGPRWPVITSPATAPNMAVAGPAAVTAG